MSSLDFDLDSQISCLETEWRQAYETSVSARAEVLSLISAAKPNTTILAKAHDRLERAEGLKARIMAKIERLEDSLLGRDS
jgi:hypothetical protein